MQVGDVVAGRYRLVRLIGRGGMGVVFEAADQRLGDRSVALKFLKAPTEDAEFHVRFQREAKTLASLDSPHIVKIYDNGSEGDGLFLVTELVPDGDLRTWIHERGPFAPLTAVRICEQLCDALSDAHEQKIIHRDVKPANVLLRRRRGELWAYLADFGIARTDTEDLTRSGVVVGSVSYMAPERHLGSEADERSDIYSLGCVLWALLEGRAPYSGTTDFQVMVAHVEKPVPALSESVVGRDLITPVLDRLLAKRPEERIGSAEEARTALAALAARLSIVSGAEDIPVAPVGTDPADPDLTMMGTISRELAAADPPVGEVTLVRTPSGELVPSASSSAIDGDGEAPASGRAMPGDQDGSRRRRLRTLLVAVAVAALVAVVAVVGVLAAGDGDSPDNAAGPGSSTPSSGTTEEAVPLGAPKVEHEPAYRGVKYVVAPVDGATFQVRRDGTWVDLDATRFTEPTEQGGDKVCLWFRAVSAATGAAGEPREVCDRAAAPTIKWMRLERPCLTDAGQPCAYFNVDVAGFRSGAQLPVSLSTLDGTEACGVGNGCLRPVRIGKDGRARVDATERVDARPAAFVVGLAIGTQPVDLRLRVGDESVVVRQPVR